MTRAIFLFIASVLLLLPFVFTAGAISVSSQLILCTPFLLLLGIPHGAIDHILYLKNNKLKHSHFIGIYLLLVGSNIALWMLLPSIAYVLFLLLSGYHFGQSQFSHYFNEEPVYYRLFYLFWGVSLLAGLVYFNLDEIHLIMNQYDEFAAFRPLHQDKLMFQIFLASSFGTLFFLVMLTIKKSLTVENLMMEVLVLSLVLVCFFLMPLLIGFTLYFVILHSFKVLREEYNYLNAEIRVNSIGGFVKVLAPFTLFSFAGIGLLFGMIYLNWLTISYGYCLLIIISSITLPHVFVMNRFYKLLLQRGFLKQLA
jgi:Brp/Blh family beta-carotene 15,15'-monooxygenase